MEEDTIGERRLVFICTVLASGGMLLGHHMNATLLAGLVAGAVGLSAIVFIWTLARHGGDDDEHALIH